MGLILNSAGVSYISTDNLKLVLLNPIAVIGCICLILLTAFTVFFEVVALYIYCESGWQRNQISIIRLLKETLRQCKKMLHIQNILLFLGFIITTILAFLPFAPYMLQWLRIPEFIMDFIKQDSKLFFAYVIVVLIANLICFLFLFFLPYTLFDDFSIKEAWKKGNCLLKKKKTVTIFRVLGLLILFSFIVVIILSIAVLGLVVFTKLNEAPADVVKSFTLYFNRGVPAAIFLMGAFGTIFFFSALVSLFHQYKGDIRPCEKAVTGRKRFRVLKYIVMVVCAAIGILMFSESELGGSLLNQTYTTPQIVAHRADVISTPENTMAALNHAIANGVDMVEIDVQQLKDGSLILLHDDNFLRTTGHKKKVWEVEYSEVGKYDAGSWFSSEFIGEPVPTLESILQRAKENIQVMIELKSTGHEENLVGQVIELIEKYEMIDQCHIGSMNLDILRETKAVNPKIKTVYITPLIYSGKYDMDFVDAFSVETTVMTREMVVAMQGQGKKVYGWTANSEDTIKKNLLCRVDGIVTDVPIMVKHYEMMTKENLILNFVLELFFENRYF